VRALATVETETLEERIGKQVLAAFREDGSEGSASLDEAWREALEAEASMDDAQREGVRLWAELAEGLFSGPPDMADHHDDYAYGKR
jgi:hypothetical protein